MTDIKNYVKDVVDLSKKILEKMKELNVVSTFLDVELTEVDFLSAELQLQTEDDPQKISYKEFLYMKNEIDDFFGNFSLIVEQIGHSSLEEDIDYILYLDEEEEDIDYILYLDEEPDPSSCINLDKRQRKAVTPEGNYSINIHVSDLENLETDIQVYELEKHKVKSVKEQAKLSANLLSLSTFLNINDMPQEFLNVEPIDEIDVLIEAINDVFIDEMCKCEIKKLVETAYVESSEVFLDVDFGPRPKRNGLVFNKVGYNFRWNSASTAPFKNKKISVNYQLQDKTFSGFLTEEKPIGIAIRSLKDESEINIPRILMKYFENSVDFQEVMNIRHPSRLLFCLSKGEVSSSKAAGNYVCLLNKEKEVVSCIKEKFIKNLPLFIKEYNEFVNSLEIELFGYK